MKLSGGSAGREEKKEPRCEGGSEEKRSEGQQGVNSAEVRDYLEGLISRYREYFQHRSRVDLFDEAQLEAFVEEKVRPVLFRNATMAEVNGVPGNLLEDLYAVGFRAFSRGDYLEAGRMFTFITIQNHREARYAYSAGRSFESLGEYDIALKYYFLAANIDRLSPEYIYRLAYCLYIMGQEARAIDGFNVVVTVTKNEPGRRDMEMAARAMVEMISSDKRLTRSTRRRAARRKV